MTVGGGIAVFLIGMMIGTSLAMAIGAIRTWRPARQIKRFQDHPDRAVQQEWDIKAISDEHDEQYKVDVEETIKHPLAVSILFLIMSGGAVLLFVYYAQHAIADWLLLVIGSIWSFSYTIRKAEVQPLKRFYGWKPNR